MTSTSAATSLVPAASGRVTQFLIPIAIGLTLWFTPVPTGLEPRAWHLFAIFVGTIVGAIARPLPMGPVVLAGMVAAMLTGSADFEVLFASFSQPTVWLVAFAFFMAVGLIKSGLAQRAAFLCVAKCGSTTLGLAYSLVFGEALLAPFIPSIMARSGGIMYPLVAAIAGERDDGIEGSPGRHTARFLTIAAFQGSVITSGLFLTSMAANPMMMQLASELQVSLSWAEWARATIVPGVCSLLLAPYVIYRFAPPGQNGTPEAPELARRRLSQMGPISSAEWGTMAILGLVLLLWVAGPYIGVGSTLAVMIGLLLMMCTGLLNWEDCLGEKAAWHTFFWLAGLVAMGAELRNVGFFTWFGGHIDHALLGVSWQVGFPLICIAYFYSHYLFASNTAHAMAMYFVCLASALQLGAPPKVAALMLAVLTNLFGGITHYGNAPAPLYFSSGVSSLRCWWGVGFAVSVSNLLVWLVVGMLWWKVIGLW